MTEKRKKIAIVTPDLTHKSGVSTIAKFLFDIINATNDLRAELVSVSTSSRDENSIRLLNPKTWLSEIKVTDVIENDWKYRHVGANLTEIEFFRYRPRRVLDDILDEFDLIQIVAGAPPWSLVAENFAGKVALQVATLTKNERESIVKLTPQPRKIWLQAMNRINAKLEKRAFKRADAIFIENHWLKEILEKDCADKTFFAPPGIDTDFFTPKCSKQKGYILSVGRFNDVRKNVKMLFRAYKRLIEIEEDAPRLVLAGLNAPSKEDLAVAENLQIIDKIDIYTNLTFDELREIYQNASVFALSSNEEGFGLVIIEAMACGLPVVATRCGGAEVTVSDGENGFLVPLDDAEMMAQKISELLRDERKRSEFGQRGRKLVENNYSITATSQIYLETYRRLLA